MFLPFFDSLRRHGVPASPREFLSFLEGLAAGLCRFDIDGFYYFARATMVKDERHLDRFDRAFAESFRGLDAIPPEAVLDALQLPEDWLRKLAEKHLTPEEKAQIAALGGFEKLMETLRERLKEQEGRHQGGNKWIGTAGTSPFGAYGYNPEGVRIGQLESRHQRAVKVWDKREFRDFDDRVELGTRNIKVALRRLRKFAREGHELELDLPDTIRSTAANAGYLDIKMVPERHNNVKVLLLMDVGGTMDEHIQRVEELFSAVKAEFKHLEFYYFHNCVYDFVWKNNRRRFAEKFPTWDIIRKYNKDYKLIFVGDATMSPYEILQPGGSVEYNNEEPGAEWIQRLTHAFPKFAWINPEPQGVWQYRQSISIIQQLIGNRMFPLSLKGLEDTMRLLSK